MERVNVYAIIDGERAYQDKKHGTLSQHNHTFDECGYTP